MGPTLYSFGQVLDMLTSGVATIITRHCWRGTGSEPQVLIQRPDANSKMTEPYLYMSKNGGKNVFPLDLSCESILAQDWIIVA